jgi:type VI secretion system protein ImpK
MSNVSIYRQSTTVSNSSGSTSDNSSVRLNENTITNPIINAATPILTLVAHIKKSKKPTHLEHIREDLISNINVFDDVLTQLGYTKKIILAAKYCLCTAIDESILRTEWGTKTPWVQNTLLNHFHNETWGGERFYIILEVLNKNPRENIGLLELLYILLSLGFEGKYYGENTSIREDIQYKTLQTIKHISGKQSRQLATHTHDLNAIKKEQEKSKPLKWFYYGLVGIVIGFALNYNIKLSNSSSNLLKQLNNIAETPPITTFSQLIDRPIISEYKDN